MKLVCKCGHPKPAHTRAEGPNSIGQHFFGGCTAGWRDIFPFLVAGAEACWCYTYRARWWRPVFSEEEEE